MKKVYALIAWLLIAALCLTGCGVTPPGGEATVPTETTQPTTQNTIPATAGTTLPGETEVTTLPTQTTEPATQPTQPATQPTQPTTVPPTEPTQPPTEPTQPPEGEEGFKAIWLSQYDMNPIYTDGGVQREKVDFTRRAGQLMDRIRSLGINTVILQVRPNGDSMYPSQYYPVSKYVVGSYGAEAAYDPVAILVDAAHDRGLEIHGWINPMRAMSVSEIAQVDGAYPIRQWLDDPALHGKYLVAYNGTYYLNPAYEEVRQLIADGARELLETYDFDGLHMDDYFYPTTDAAFDAAAYGDYQAAGGKADLAQFRREALNALVSELYAMVKSVDAELVYGISPAGNINTVYQNQYADVYTWCAQPGYIDYICPQVYFGLEHQSFDFVSVCKTWQSIIKSDRVELIVGMTLGKAYTGEDQWAGSGKNEWRENKDILASCLEATRQLEKCRGVAFFCYQYFFDPVSGEEIRETSQEVANLLPVLEKITWG